MHNHWWAFFFGEGEAKQVYFTEMPCGTTPGDDCIGSEIGRIVLANKERFAGAGAGKCRPVEVPPELEIPEYAQRRLMSQAEVKSIYDSRGKAH